MGQIKRRRDFMKKFSWIFALVAALAMVLVGCDDGKNSGGGPVAEGNLVITDASAIGALLSSAGWNGHVGGDVSVAGNVAKFAIPANGSTDNQGFRIDFPEAAKGAGYLALEITFEVSAVTSIPKNAGGVGNAKIGFKSGLAGPDVTPYDEYEIVFGTQETALGKVFTQRFPLTKPNILDQNLVYFSHNKYGPDTSNPDYPVKKGADSADGAINYDLKIAQLKFVGGEETACCTDCDAEACDDCAEGLCGKDGLVCFVTGDTDQTGKCCIPAELKIDWTAFNKATGLTKEALGFEANWGGSEGVTTFNDEGKYITFNKSSSGLFSIALPAGTAADDLVVITYVAVAEKGEPKLILKKNGGGTDLGDASWIMNKYPTLDVAKTSVLALDMSKVTDFAGLTKLSFQENVSAGDKFHIKIISVEKEKLTGFDLTIAVSATEPNSGVGAAATAAMSGADLTFTWAAEQSGRIGFIALTPGQEAVLMAAAKNEGSLKITVAGTTTNAESDYRACLGKVNVGANWNGSGWIGAAPDKFANIVGEKAVAFNGNSIGQIDNADNPGSRLQYLIIQARDATASTITISSVKIEIVPKAAE
jgi:hypothetical protein